MLSAPVAFPRLGDRRLIVFATPITMASEALGIALACEDVAEHRYPRLPVQIADHLSQFEVHLLKSFLHLRHGSRGHGNKHTALP